MSPEGVVRVGYAVLKRFALSDDVYSVPFSSETQNTVQTFGERHKIQWV